jgi:hypothetical protein
MRKKMRKTKRGPVVLAAANVACSADWRKGGGKGGCAGVLLREEEGVLATLLAACSWSRL